MTAVGDRFADAKRDLRALLSRGLDPNIGQQTDAAAQCDR